MTGNVLVVNEFDLGRWDVSEKRSPQGGRYSEGTLFGPGGVGQISAARVSASRGHVYTFVS